MKILPCFLIFIYSLAVQGASVEKHTRNNVLDPHNSEESFVSLLSLGHHSKDSIKLERNGTCEENATNVDVHVMNPETKEFSILYSVCFDESTSTTLYSHSFVDGKAYASGDPETGQRPSGFENAGFFPFDINTSYKQKEVAKTLSGLLGSEEKVEEYFHSKGSFFFARGHLFPNSDPFRKYLRDATFFYINVVPQWQNLNGGGWKEIEGSVRGIAKKLGSRVNVWTGTHGILSLKDVNQKPVELWLGPLDSEVKRLPVPNTLWKVVQSEVYDEAVAIVQINNPYAVVTKEDLLCESICDDLKWLSKSLRNSLTNVKKGYTYCCDVNALREKIHTIPEIKYSKVLYGATEPNLGKAGDENVEEEGDYLKDDLE